MSVKAISLTLDDETLKRVGQMAEAMGRPREWLMAEAIKLYVAREGRFVLEVGQGIQAADDGRLIDHADVKARWESKRGVSRA